MFHPLMYDTVQRDRARALDEQLRAAYVRRLVVARRLQRKADAAHRALAVMVVR